jgi:uroporphyrinogen-III synthase
MEYFLLTRPKEESQEMALILKSMGLESLINPLLEIKELEGPNNLHLYQSFIITSSKAIQYLPNNSNTTLWCVGENTAKKCQEKNFKQVIHRKNIEELIEVILEQSPQDIGKILYLRGKTITVDLKGLLTTLGYSTEQHVCYEAAPIDEFFPATKKAFLKKQIKYTALFSVQSTINFIDSIRKFDLCSTLSTVLCFAYSPQIAEHLNELPFQKLIICPSPTMDSFWNEVKNCVS